MIQKMEFLLFSWKKKFSFCKKILHTLSTVPSIISINTIIQTSENILISKEATGFLCALPLGVCPAFVCRQIHLSLTSTFLYRCKIPRSLDPPFSNFLGHLEKGLPVIQTELLCFRACPAVRSLHKDEASGVSTARKLLPPTGYISGTARDTVSIATQGVLFFWWIISKNRKTTSGVSAASAPPSPACQSQQETIPLLAGLGWNILGDRVKASKGETEYIIHEAYSYPVRSHLTAVIWGVLHGYSSTMPASCVFSTCYMCCWTVEW